MSECGGWCEYYNPPACDNDEQLADYCPLYNPMTGKHKPTTKGKEGQDE
jgi:Zn-finger protein